jgi:hypothetical protein
VGILVGVIMAGAAVFWGCNREGGLGSIAFNDSQRLESPRITTSPEAVFSMETGIGRVDILSVITDKADLAVTFGLGIHPNQGLAYNRNLIVSLKQTELGDVSFLAGMTSPDGNLVLQLEKRVLAGDSGGTRIVVKTPSDAVSVTHRETPDALCDLLVVNGDQLLFTIQKSDLDRMRLLYSEGAVDGVFQASNISNRIPSDKPRIEQLVSLQDFWKSHPQMAPGSDLQLVLSVISNGRVNSLIRDSIGTPGDATVASFWGKLCAVAGICTGICEFVPPNAVCLTCGATALGCAIVALFRD